MTMQYAMKQALCCATLALTAAASNAAVLRVDQSARPGGNGTSWETAFDNLHDALDATQPGDAIWIAGGTYVPFRAAVPTLADARTSTFYLRDGVSLFGGFAGFETSLDQRDPAEFPTVLSGDRLGDDLPELENRSDNVYTVLTAESVSDVLLDGLSIERGHGSGRGAGINMDASHVLCRDVVFFNNYSSFLGGAIHTEHDHAAGETSSLTIESCRFEANISEFLGGAIVTVNSDLMIIDSRFETNKAVQDHAGAIFVITGGNVLIEQSEFVGNRARRAGAMLIQRFLGYRPVAPPLNAVIRDCIFRQNQALMTGSDSFQSAGGGLEIALTNDPDFGDHIVVESCDFVDNEANAAAGAIAVIYGDDEPTLQPCSITFDRCRFIGNSALFAGGLAIVEPDVAIGSIVIRNSIIDGNHATEYPGGGILVQDAVGIASIESCTVINNTSFEGAAGIETFSTFGPQWKRPDVSSTIVSGNVSNEMTGLTAQYDDPTLESVRFSLIQDLVGTDLNGNLGGDPLFIDPDGPDGVPGTGDEDYSLQSGSPAIDRGDPSMTDGEDFAGLPRVQQCRADIGAIESPFQSADDCNMNGIADACEPDCDANGVPDDCQIAVNPMDDCNGDGIPNDCEADCNGNGISDVCEDLQMLGVDCNDNGIPDACEPDCNADGVLDECEILAGALDVDGNGIPDTCEADCNSNLIPDAFEIAKNPALDCDANGIPDTCDVVLDTDRDCNGNGILDVCDADLDCNGNAIPDSCELTESGTVQTQQAGTPVEDTLSAYYVAADDRWVASIALPRANQPNPGRVEVFERRDNALVLHSVLTPEIGERYEYDIVLDGNALYVAGYRPDPSSAFALQFGVFTFVYHADTNSWLFTTFLRTAYENGFSGPTDQILVDDDLVALTFTRFDYDNDQFSSAAVFYDIEGDGVATTWERIGAVEFARDDEPIRARAALQGRQLIAARNFYNGDLGTFRNSVAVFEQTGYVWPLVQEFGMPNTTSGFAADMDGDSGRVAIGDEHFQVEGGVFLLVENPETHAWEHVTTIVPTNAPATDEFGRRLHLSGDKLLIGAPNIRGGSAYPPGMVFA
ncbi:MAG: right-handed parallel beta-helix repeat-containing protein [Planctomycetota bacterium]